MKKFTAFIICIIMFSSLTSFTVSSAPNEILAVKADGLTFSFEPDTNSSAGDMYYEILSVTDADGQTTAYAKVEDLWNAIGYYLTFDETERAYIIDGSTKFAAKTALREAKTLPYTRVPEAEKEKIAFPPLSFLKPVEVYASEGQGIDGTFVYNAYKILYWDSLLDLGGKKLLSVTGGSHEGVYLPLRAAAEALGYYVGWDSFNENVVVSRYEEEALNADRLNAWSLYLDLEDESSLIKWMDEAWFKNNVIGQVWENLSSSTYIKLEIAADGSYTFTVKDYNDPSERFSKSLGTWQLRKSGSGLDFFPDSEMEYNAYGEEVAFAPPQHCIPSRALIGYLDKTQDTIYLAMESEADIHVLVVLPLMKVIR